MKKCTKCGVVKSYELFDKHIGKKDGYASNCKECRKLYRVINADKIREYGRTEGRKKQFRDYRIRNREKCREYSKNYNAKYILLNKKERRKYENEYRKNRYKVDPLYRYKIRCRSRVRSFYKSKGFKRNNTTQEMIGCSWEFLVEYLGKKFYDGMSHTNYYLWHIDHIIPLDSAKTEKDIYRLCHYTNLQPMWGEDNVKKSNKII